MEEKVMDVLYLVLCDTFYRDDFGKSFEDNILSNVCEEYELNISDVFPTMQLMENKHELIGYLFKKKASNKIEQYILNEIKNQIKEYIFENEDFLDNIIEQFCECYSGDIREFLLSNNVIDLINEL